MYYQNYVFSVYIAYMLNLYGRISTIVISSYSHIQTICYCTHPKLTVTTEII